MKLLLDNTLIHRVGHVLDSRRGGAIRPVDALALFHMAEHVLFSDDIIVSDFEAAETRERTGAVVDSLAAAGITLVHDGASLIRIEQFTEAEYAAVCADAAPMVVAELTGLRAAEIEHLGQWADDAARPKGRPIPTLETWSRPEAQLPDSAQRRAELLADRAGGAFELMVLDCQPLHHRLQELWQENRSLRPKAAAAITVLIRASVNQALAQKRSALYSPAPARVQVLGAANTLWRHRLEKVIRNLVTEQSKLPGRLLAELTSLDQVPLPLFAFHALRGARAGSPQALLEAARAARDDAEVRAVRKWLSRWESKSLSVDSRQRFEALAELRRWESELQRILKADPGIVSSLRTGGSIDVNPETGEMSWSPPIPTLGELWSAVVERHRKQHQLLVAMTLELASDGELGGRIIRQLDRFLGSTDVH